MELIITDGGRSKAGYKGRCRDCVCRAITVATGLPYSWVYKELARLNKTDGGVASARNGLRKDVYEPFLKRLGFRKLTIPTTKVGNFTPPMGTLIVCMPGHVAACVDGVLYDSWDSRKDGKNDVYGYWIKE